MLGLGLTRSGKPRSYQDQLASRSQAGNGGRGDGDTEIRFERFNVEGTMTFTENQTIAGESGWLKAVYDTTQTNTSGLQIRNLIGEELLAPGMFYSVDFKIYLYRSSNWLQGAADNTTVTVDCIFGDGLYQQEVTPETVTTFDTGAVELTSQANDILIRFQTTDDLPAANAQIYIKELNFQVGTTAASVT